MTVYILFDREQQLWYALGFIDDDRFFDTSYEAGWICSCRRQNTCSIKRHIVSWIWTIGDHLRKGAFACLPSASQKDDRCVR